VIIEHLYKAYQDWCHRDGKKPLRVIVAKDGRRFAGTTAIACPASPVISSTTSAAWSVSPLLLNLRALDHRQVLATHNSRLEISIGSFTVATRSRRF
jgi:hypothetical protein